MLRIKEREMHGFIALVKYHEYGLTVVDGIRAQDSNQ